MASGPLLRLTERYRTLSVREPRGEDAPTEKTRIGLTELHTPREVLIDFIFVHGLRGGSYKTWRKYEDPGFLWPKSWLPLDPDFLGVRTSTFGYQSDWTSRQGNILNVHDFGRKLYGELRTSPFLRKPRDTPIVLIGHSMGGIVIKKAYLLAHREMPTLANRIKTIVFLATPHRGSDSVSLLRNILEVTGHEKEYVTDLLKNSPSLQLINDEFRHHANEVGIWSFYEERRMRIGVSSDFIVDRDSATLGYEREHVFSLDANHREMCKFESLNDSNYVTLRNTLATIVDELLGRGSETYVDRKIDQMKSISSLLNIFESPKEDFEEQERLKTPGTCRWIDKKANFLRWLHSARSPEPSWRKPTTQPGRSSSPSDSESNCRMFWLTAQPGAGKSVCAAHVISLLQDQGYDCCYYFFHHSGKSKALLSSMFRSLAFQMAETHAEVRNFLHQISLNTTVFDRDDEGAVWKHIFMRCIFKCQMRHPQFWVLDAMDECSNAAHLFDLLMKLQSEFPLRIFITSRPQPNFERGLSRLRNFSSVTADKILREDTGEDMKICLALQGAWADDDDEEEQISDTLLAKSNGCFLWFKLVCQELEEVYLKESVESVLDEIPTGMWALYERSLAQMASNIRDKKLTLAILTFSVCAIRPLKLPELRTALRIDANLVVRNLRISIEGLCGGFLYVDKNDCVQLIHSTARDFLFSKENLSEYALEQGECHERLAMTCLRYMEIEMQPPRSRSFGAALELRSRETSAFTHYAATAFSEHVAASSSTLDSLLIAIARFLNSSVLAWIEHVASKEPSLYCLTRTAKNFIRYLGRRAKHLSPLGNEFKLVQEWANDLMRLVAKFGRNLREEPSSIYYLIPSIAPKESRLYECSLNSPSWLKVYGDATHEWDDCLSFIEYRNTYATALACGQYCFAVGMRNGCITVYDCSTCQEKIAVTHCLPKDSTHKQSNMVKLLAFGSSDETFASCGLESICVWLSTGDMLHLFKLNEPQVNMIFSLDSDSIITVSRSSRVHRFELKDTEDADDTLIVRTLTNRRRSAGYYNTEGLQLPRQAPLAAAVSPDQKTLALLFRGKPIYLYSLEDNTLLGLCGRDVDSDASNISVLTALFHPNPDVNILAVSHQDGDLVLFDPWTRKELRSVYGDAYSLAASGSGQFLGTGNTGGTIRIWSFETLDLLYVIKCGLEEVRGLAFTGDGMRIIDRRDSKVKVWEPNVLVRQSTAEDENSLSDTTTLAPPEFGENEEEITTAVLSADDEGLFIFAGHSDGSIAVYDAKEGSLLSTIPSEVGEDYIVAMASANKMLAIGNSSQTVTVFKLLQGKVPFKKDQILIRKKVPEPIQQLIICPSRHFVLTVTADSDLLWDVRSRRSVKTYSYDQSTVVSRRRWTSIGDNIAALSIGEEVRLYDWATLEARKSVQLAIPGVGQNPLPALSREVGMITLSVSGEHLVIALVPQTLNRFRTRIAIWTRPFNPGELEDPSISLATDLDFPLEDVRYFLGVHQDRIVFLDHNLWIRSFDPREILQTGTDSIRKHIFIPADLIGSMTEAQPIVTSQGLLVFSKAGNLAIFEGALDWDFSNSRGA